MRNHLLCLLSSKVDFLFCRYKAGVKKFSTLEEARTLRAFQKKREQKVHREKSLAKFRTISPIEGMLISLCYKFYKGLQGLYHWVMNILAQTSSLCMDGALHLSVQTFFSK